MVQYVGTSPTSRLDAPGDHSVYRVTVVRANSFLDSVTSIFHGGTLTSRAPWSSIVTDLEDNLSALGGIVAELGNAIRGADSAEARNEVAELDLLVDANGGGLSVVDLVNKINGLSSFATVSKVTFVGVVPGYSDGGPDAFYDQATEQLAADQAANTQAKPSWLDQLKELLGETGAIVALGVGVVLAVKYLPASTSRRYATNGRRRRNRRR